MTDTLDGSPGYPGDIIHPDAIDAIDDPAVCGLATYDAIRGSRVELANVPDSDLANKRYRRHREITRHLRPIVDELTRAWLEDRGWTDEQLADHVSTNVIIERVESALWSHIQRALEAAPAVMWRANPRLAPREQRHLDHDEEMERQWEDAQRPEVRS